MEHKDEDIEIITKNLSYRLFDETKMYTYMKSYASAKKFYQTVRVLPYVREMHEGQYRKYRNDSEKVPYIYHPLMVACHGLALGFEDDDLLSAALLHDVCEDCNVRPEDLPVNEATRAAVSLLTKDKIAIESSDYELGRYYEALSKNRIASIVKLLDRCNNISTMSTSFTGNKMARYIAETEKYIYPLMDKTANEYPEYASQVFLIKYHMSSVVETIRHGMAKDNQQA